MLLISIIISSVFLLSELYYIQYKIIKTRNDESRVSPDLWRISHRQIERSHRMGRQSGPYFWTFWYDLWRLNLAIMFIDNGSLKLIYIYNTTTPPPGESCPLRLEASVGYHWIGLDPQGPKMGEALRISGPDQRGRRQQVPGGPGPGHPQESIFWENCWSKDCSACKTGLVWGFFWTSRTIWVKSSPKDTKV